MIEKEILEKTLKYNYSTELDKLRQHIVDLRIVPTSFESHLQEKDREIDRLNNIINKYDEFLKHELSFEGHSVEWIENKLQELKGSDKE